MTVQIEYEAQEMLNIPYRELAEKVVSRVLEDEQCPYEAEVNLVLTDNEEIQRINKEFRGIDAPTDVLSFPSIPFGEPADYKLAEEEDSFFNMDTGELILGDIMISVPRVFQQAKEYGHSVKREFSFLIAHSVLHLLGYDHMEKEEAEIMEGKQRKALEELGITR